MKYYCDRPQCPLCGPNCTGHTMPSGQQWLELRASHKRLLEAFKKYVRFGEKANFKHGPVWKEAQASILEAEQA